jgi:hypothetical protein
MRRWRHETVIMFQSIEPAISENIAAPTTTGLEFRPMAA